MILYKTNSRVTLLLEYIQFRRFSLEQKNIKKVAHTRKNNSVRTHSCGELNVSHIGKNVSLCGWIQFQRLDRFAILRDGYGSTQIIIPEQRVDLISTIKRTPLESVISVSGIVEKRPDAQCRMNEATGEIELSVHNLEVLNAVQRKLPFTVRDFNKASESLRMKYRYLDLRYPTMQKNLRLRSELLMKMRHILINHEAFVEVETPTLFKRTPGGAQEFIVPTRTAGEFFSLVQSPQQFKQLLMVGGVDKYFQVARCYRDERARPDRQPEFTQMDIEMSFCSSEDIIDLIENLLKYSWPKELTIPFQRMTYNDALKLYGTDQPDISFNCRIFKVDSSLTHVKCAALNAVKIPQAAVYFTNLLKKELNTIIKDRGANVQIMKFSKENTEGLKKTLLQLGIKYEDFIQKNSIHSGDLVFLAKGEEKETLMALGKCRVWFLRHLRSEGKSGEWESEDKGQFLWLTDIPLFEEGNDGLLKSMHHPFTMPHQDDLEILQSNPLQVRSQSFDLVLDGYEVGGGSIRIHNPQLQEYILSLLQVSTESLKHLVEALASGAPPHGGIALGIDRLMSILVSAQSIRDVIAFPKSSEGRDLMSDSPTNVSSEELELYNISIASPKVKL